MGVRFLRYLAWPCPGRLSIAGRSLAELFHQNRYYGYIAYLRLLDSYTIHAMVSTNRKRRVHEMAQA